MRNIIPDGFSAGDDGNPPPSEATSTPQPPPPELGSVAINEPPGDEGVAAQPRKPHKSRNGKARKSTSPVPEIARVDQRTEMAAARRFVALHGSEVRYVGPWKKWLIWDGTRWRIDELCQIEKLAKQTARFIWGEIANELLTIDRQTAASLTTYGRIISSASGIAHMLSLARSEPNIAVMPEALDSHPWLLNCLNGTIDLRTGSLLPHDRTHYLTKIVPHEFLRGAEAECPIWETTIATIFDDRQDVIGFFRRLCGSAIAGEVRDHILPIFWGGGRNGKSLIVETLLATLGDDFALKGVPEMLLSSTHARHPTEIADLCGKQLVFCNESEEDKRFSEAAVKTLTGGDTITARRMREDFWRFRPSHTIFLVTNHKPRVRGTDDGIWRRLRLVPFTVKFWDRNKGESGPPELQADTTLNVRLLPELPGILAWMVNACLEWQRDGLGQPAAVTLATDQYQLSMNTFSAFLQECCIVEEGVTCKAGDLMETYQQWCQANGEDRVSGRRLWEILEDMEITKKRSNGMWYSGIGILADSGRVEGSGEFSG